MHSLPLQAYASVDHVGSTPNRRKARHGWILVDVVAHSSHVTEIEDHTGCWCSLRTRTVTLWRYIYRQLGKHKNPANTSSTTRLSLLTISGLTELAPLLVVRRQAPWDTAPVGRGSPPPVPPLFATTKEQSCGSRLHPTRRGSLDGKRLATKLHICNRTLIINYFIVLTTDLYFKTAKHNSSII